MKVYGNLNVKNNKIKNLVLDSGSSFPLSPIIGMPFYLEREQNSGLHIYTRNGWKNTKDALYGGQDPDFIPGQAGQIYINTSERTVFISVGSTQVDDWIGITASTLTTGMPAYREPLTSTLISIDSTPYVFYLATNGNRNVYLNTINAVSSNTFRPVMSGNKFIRHVLLQSSSNTTGNAEFILVVNGVQSEYRWTLLNGTKQRVIQTACPLNDGQEISLYLSSSKNVANPYIRLEIADR